MIPDSNFSPGHILLNPTWLALAALTGLLVGCFPSADQNLLPGDLPVATAGAPDARALNVVTTNTVLADLVSNVGGELVSVASLIPAGADVHTFQTTPTNSLVIGAADLIISNGAGLDDFLTPVLANARRPEAVHIVATLGLEVSEIEGGGFPEIATGRANETANHPGSDSSKGDPHFWLDPTITVHYAQRIIDGLSEADPRNAQRYATNGQAYIVQLRLLDQEISQTLAQVPPSNRHLVTFHDAYGYFARRYQWKISAFVPSDASDVTPGDIATILEQIKREGIPAVFAEPQFSSNVLWQAAQDAGVEVGVIRSLVDNQTPTYVDMMRTNARSLVENLG